MRLLNNIKVLKGVLSAKINKNYRCPLSMYYLVTYRCPYSCRYCNITKDIPAMTELDTEQAKSLIDQMADSGTIKLQFTGGEPMLRDDIGELIDHAKKRKMFVGISTSGFSISEKIDRIKNVDIVLLSLEGPGDVHDSIRGKESFEMVKDAMNILRANNKDFWTTTVVNKINKDYLEYILEWAKKDKFISNFVMMHSRDEDPSGCFDTLEIADEFFLDNDDYRGVFKKLIEYKKNGYPIGTSLHYLRFLSEWDDYKKGFSTDKKDFRCLAGRLYGFLEPDGTLYPCGTLHGKFSGRNTLKKGFKESFMSLEDPVCNSCLSGCQTEQNLLFSFKIDAILNWLKFLRKNKYDE